MFKESMLIEKLQQAELFDHSIKDFSVKETHLSWVILTGEYAYKIKKPVDFGFVNFTTLDKRKHFCSLELKLNKRLTDSVYIDVIPIYGTSETPSLQSDAGEIIEYAIKMHQFEQNNIFDVLQEDDKIETEHIVSLAKQIAKFHSKAQVIDTNSNMGGYASVEESTMGNFNAFETFEIEDEDKDKLNSLLSWTKIHLKQNIDLFEKRKISGFVRHCHGDIHLGNIALVNKEPVIFDCIDFNEDFYWIDTINEIAFLAMDLMLKGEQEHAINFINSYLEITNDYEGASLLKFYLIYRALVRAKVAMYTDQKQLYSLFKSYIELATKIKNTKSTDIFITFGISGSGKSTYAKRHSVKYNAIIIRSDVERNFLCNGKMSYDDNITDLVYKNLLTKASNIIMSGFNILLDATFLKRKYRKDTLFFAKEHGIIFTILKLDTDLETIKKRLQSRSNDISEATIDIAKEQIKNIESLSETEQEHCVNISTLIEDTV